jgi:pseudouridine kinase
VSDVIVIGGANVDVKAKAVQHHRYGTSNPGIVTTTAGGVGRNIAHNLARLGVDVSLISAVGNDAHGDTVLKATSSAGVNVSMVEHEPVPTGTYVAMLDNNGELVSAVSDMRILDLITPDTVRQHIVRLQSARFIVADCNLPLDTLNALAMLCGGRLAVEPVSVQKSRKLMEVLKRAEILVATPNMDQIESLLGTRDVEKACVLLHEKGLRNVVVHAGSEGAFASDMSGTSHVPPAGDAKVVEVTGAGDAAMAGLVYGLLNGDNLVKSVEFGQLLAAKVIASAQSTLE